MGTKPDPLGFYRRYIIFNPKTGAFKPSYGLKTVPALYTTFGLANGELKKQRGYRSYLDYEVREVELQVLV